MSDSEITSGSSSSQSGEQIASHPVDKYIEERKAGAMSREIPRELELDFSMSSDAEHGSEGHGGGTSTETSSSDVDNAADTEGDNGVYYNSSSSSPSSSPTTGQQEVVVKDRPVHPRVDGGKNASSLRLPPPLESLEDDTCKNAPCGVVIVDEKAFETRTSEMARLLRQPRYFDEDFEMGITCFKCGGYGHMARDCPNPQRQKPCFVCAEFGHSSRNCPNAVCYRCGGTGHQARDCYGRLEGWEKGLEDVCRKCGRADCTAAHESDILRAEGECRSRYLPLDLQSIECFVCGDVGHANCADLAETSPKASCYNCGEGGHIGVACVRVSPTAPIRSERSRSHSRPHRDRPGRYESKSINEYVDRSDSRYYTGARGAGHDYNDSHMTRDSGMASKRHKHRGYHASSTGIDIWGSQQYRSTNSNKYHNQKYSATDRSKSGVWPKRQYGNPDGHRHYRKN